MSLGRRKVSLEEQSRWVFNRMADVYDARPPYPPALLDRLSTLACRGVQQESGGGCGRGGAPGRVVELGAGTGHVAIPLAQRGLEVVAVEPAKQMLERLEARATAAGVRVSACHACAEQLPLAARSIDLAIVADALHFLDAELTAREIGRVLVPGGAVAVVTCEFGDTPFMRGVLRAMEDAVPRRPRQPARQIVQVSSISQVPLTMEEEFWDETLVDHPMLERILRSISFIGPAMSPARFAAFRGRVHALSEPPKWARRFVLRWGHQIIPGASLRRAAARRASRFVPT